MEKLGLETYFSGLASQMDFKKVKLERWQEQFKSEEEKAAQQAAMKKRGRELLKALKGK